MCCSSDDRRPGPVGGRHRARLTLSLCVCDAPQTIDALDPWEDVTELG